MTAHLRTVHGLGGASTSKEAPASLTPAPPSLVQMPPLPLPLPPPSPSASLLPPPPPPAPLLSDAPRPEPPLSPMASVNAHLKSLEEAWGVGGGPASLPEESDDTQGSAAAAGAGESNARVDASPLPTTAVN